MADKIDINKLISELRKGKEVECPLCKKGHLVTEFDYKISHYFYCDHCKEKLILN